MTTKMKLAQARFNLRKAELELANIEEEAAKEFWQGQPATFLLGKLTFTRTWDHHWEADFPKGTAGLLAMSLQADHEGFGVHGYIGETTFSAESKPTPQEALDEAYAEICRFSKELTDFLEQYLGGPKE